MINIFDVSVYAHVGVKHAPFSSFSYKGIPTGGISLLMSDVLRCVKRGEVCAFCFDSRTNRRSILPEYKSDRCADPKVNFQRDMLYKFLYDAVPNVFKLNGAEADDLAYSLIKHHYPTTTSLITMKTCDDDWCHNIDTKGIVTKLSPTKHAMYVDERSYSQVLGNADFPVPLGAVTLKKVYAGDGDLSSGVVFDTGCDYSASDLYKANLGYLNNEYSKLKNKECVLEFGRTILKDIIPKENYELWQRRVEVFFPREFDINLEVLLIHKDSLSAMLSLFGCKKTAEKYGILFNEDMGSLQEELKRTYLEYHTHSKSRTTERVLETTNNFNRGEFE